jgi:hypothetical protein
LGACGKGNKRKRGLSHHVEGSQGPWGEHLIGQGQGEGAAGDRVLLARAPIALRCSKNIFTVLPDLAKPSMAHGCRAREKGDTSGQGHSGTKSRSHVEYSFILSKLLG